MISTSAPQLQQTNTNWTLDTTHASATFSVRHMMIARTEGRMAITKGSLQFGAEPRLEAELAVASIDTGLADRDTHLRSADFFDAENHPTIQFVSTDIADNGDETYEITGDLTIRGKTHRVVLQAEKLGEIKDPWGNTRAGVTATTTIERSAWGLEWNQLLETGGVVVSDKVKITLNVEFIRDA